MKQQFYNDVGWFHFGVPEKSIATKFLFRNYNRVLGPL